MNGEAAGGSDARGAGDAPAWFRAALAVEPEVIAPNFLIMT